jgi:DNA-binding transcriptional ArsR family regulator
VNPRGDLPITDSRAMRALAHPVRLAILSYLQRHGPATATLLAPHVGATPSVTSWHLRHLAEFGLVGDADPAQVPGDRRQRWWAAQARGFRFETADAAGRGRGRGAGGAVAAAVAGAPVVGHPGPDMNEAGPAGPAVGVSEWRRIRDSNS